MKIFMGVWYDSLNITQDWIINLCTQIMFLMNFEKLTYLSSSTGIQCFLFIIELENIVQAYPLWEKKTYIVLEFEIIFEDCSVNFSLSVDLLCFNYIDFTPINIMCKLNPLSIDEGVKLPRLSRSKFCQLGSTPFSTHA